MLTKHMSYIFRAVITSCYFMIRIQLCTKHKINKNKNVSVITKTQAVYSREGGPCGRRGATRKEGLGVGVPTRRAGKGGERGGPGPGCENSAKRDIPKKEK